MTAPLVVASTVEELEQVDAAGRIVLLRGHVAREQLTTKGFPYCESESHRRIVHAREAEGRRLARFAGRLVELESRAMRVASWGSNVVATRGAVGLVRSLT